MLGVVSGAGLCWGLPACLPEAQTHCCSVTHTHVAAACLPGAAACRYYVEDHSNQLVRTFTGNLTKMLSIMPGSLGKLAAGEAGRAATAGGSIGAAAAAGREWSATRLMQVRCWAQTCTRLPAVLVGSSKFSAQAGTHTHGLIRRGGSSRGRNTPVALTVRALADPCVCVYILAVGVLCLWCCCMQTFSGPVRRRLGARSWGAEASVREQDLPSQDSKVGSPTAAAAGQKRGSKGGLLGSGAAAWEGRPASLTHQGVSRIDEGDGGEEM